MSSEIDLLKRGKFLHCVQYFPMSKAVHLPPISKFRTSGSAPPIFRTSSWTGVYIQVNIRAHI